MALGRKQLVVMPTDTGYALVANAFSPAGVATLREAKGWATPIPPQVLIPGFPTLAALAAEVVEPVTALTEEFWPGALSVIVPAGDSLQWDLGENHGTVMLRMPAHTVASELLLEVGPLAATQASPVGQTLSTLDDIEEAFGDHVAVYLEDPTLVATGPSTVVDATSWGLEKGALRIVRAGEIPVEAIVELLGNNAVTDLTQ
jgi:tRNA threonylcarbamoyl adenosine modification protein (Sua5/YciO/YrdC/YwlC family)